jgi:hypothetical protein
MVRKAVFGSGRTGVSSEEESIHVRGQLTFDEAGAALEISSKTAASRYRYGLTKLREQFAQPSIEDGKG